MNKLRKCILISSGSVAFLFSSASSAHLLNGPLGSLPTSVARYSVSCANDRTQLLARISGRAKTSYLVKMKIEKPEEILLYPESPSSIVVVDPKSGDKTNVKTYKGYSPLARLVQGPGSYIVTISKEKKKPTDSDKKLNGRTTFNGVLHCQDQYGNHTAGDTEVLPY